MEHVMADLTKFSKYATSRSLTKGNALNSQILFFHR